MTCWPRSPTRYAGFAAQPERWTEGLPDEDTEQQVFDALTRKVSADLRRMVNDRLFLDAAELWAEARDVTGDNSAPRRATLVYHRILEPLVGVTAPLPYTTHDSFVDAVNYTIKTRATELGIGFS